MKKNIPAFCLLLIFTLHGCTVKAGTDLSDPKLTPDVIAAQQLIDSYRGRPEVLDQAYEKIKEALKSDPQNFYALKELARLQERSGFQNQINAKYKGHVYVVGSYSPGTLEMAESTIKRALLINPRFAEGFVYLGYIQFNQQKLDEAETTLKTAKLIGTTDPWLDLNLATVYEAKEDYAAAKQLWQKVIDSNTKNMNAKTTAYSFLIDSYERSGEPEKGIALYEEEIKLDPNDPWTRGNYASFLNSVGRYDEAIKQARLAIKIMDYGAAEHTLANALYAEWAEFASQGKASEGEKFFSEAHEINPDLNSIFVYEGARSGSEKLVDALLKYKGLSIDSTVEGSTALMIATNTNDAKAVANLLKLNANPNIADGRGVTPLMSAAYNGYVEIARVLLAHGADLNAKWKGNNAEAFATSGGHKELAELLRQQSLTQEHLIH